MFEARLARGANVARSPEVREAALAGTLNRPACSQCNVRYEVGETLVYTDPERGHWITTARSDELVRWSELEAVALAGFRTSLRTAAAEAFRTTAVRIVFDLDELRERLAIWDAGLDDGLVECAKLRCLAENPAIRGGGERIRVDAITSSHLHLRTPSRRWQIERRTIDAIGADPQWRERFPALFSDGFVSIDRYLR